MMLELGFVYLLISLVCGSKIFILPSQEKSHIRAVSYTGRTLAERGHQVVIAVRYSNKLGPEVLGKMEQMFFGDPNEKVAYTNTKELSDRFLRFYRERDVLGNTQFSIFDFPNAMCRYLLSDKDFYDRVKARKFDLAIVDALTVLRCHYIFVYSLGVPYISQTAMYPMDIGPISAFITYPFTTTYQFYPPGIYVPSDAGKMNVIQRFLRTIFFCTGVLMINYQTHQQYQMFRNYSHDRPLTKSLSQLASESQLWLIEQHPVLDFPRPTYENFKLIGGMNWSPSKPLSGDYAKIAQVSKSFIVVSLGGDLLHMPKDLGDKLAAAFEMLPEYLFIWANKGELTNTLSKHIMKVDWMPQNDLLAHKNCKLFITHCGNNGQFEAVGHGVPMLGIPIQRDQPSNAWRMIDKGYGLSVDLNTVTEGEIATKVREVIENPVYKENIRKAKEIFHDSERSPSEKAAFWVEHVLKHGSDYLKSDAMQMPWYQVLGYDMVVLMILFVYVSIKLIKIMFSIIRKVICGSTKEKTD